MVICFMIFTLGLSVESRYSIIASLGGNLIKTFFIYNLPGNLEPGWES